MSRGAVIAMVLISQVVIAVVVFIADRVRNRHVKSRVVIGLEIIVLPILFAIFGKNNDLFMYAFFAICVIVGLLLMRKGFVPKETVSKSVQNSG